MYFQVKNQIVYLSIINVVCEPVEGRVSMRPAVRTTRYGHVHTLNRNRLNLEKNIFFVVIDQDHQHLRQKKNIQNRIYFRQSLAMIAPLH